MYWSALQSKLQITRSLPNSKNQPQQSVNHLKSDTFKNQMAAFSACAKVNVLVGVIAKEANNTFGALCKERLSMERQ